MSFGSQKEEDPGEGVRQPALTVSRSRQDPGQACADSPTGGAAESRAGWYLCPVQLYLVPVPPVLLYPVPLYPVFIPSTPYLVSVPSTSVPSTCTWYSCT